MARLKLPTTLGLSRILEACLAREIDVVAMEVCPRMFEFSTGIYTDFSGRMIGAVVVDTKLFCALTASLGGLSEERGQELVLLQDIPEELLGCAEELFGVLSSVFFLDDGSDRLRCKLHKVIQQARDIPPPVKAFMAAPPIHQAYQVGLSGYGEGTLLYIGGKDNLIEDTDER